MKLKYRIIPQGAADGVVPLNWVFIDKKDIDACNISGLDACYAVGKALGDECAAIDIIDMDAVTVTSDGIVAPGAVVGVASVDHGLINKNFGYLPISELPYSDQMIEEEPHMKLWLTDEYKGRPLHRGPSTEDRGNRGPNNENMTMSGRIANNNCGSEVMNMVEMTEILAPYFGIYEIMTDGNVVIGVAGPEVSVGIGMVVSERHGRIFGGKNLGSYKAGMTAHNSGVYAKTVKSDYPAIAAPKKVLAEYSLKALDIGLVVGRDIGSSPALLMLAKAYGKPIDFDNIDPRAWIELNSVGITREMLEAPSKPMTRDEVIANADKIIPGMPDAKPYKVSDICEIRYVEL